MLLSTAIILVTAAALLDGLTAPNGLTDAALTLLLGVLTLLVGTVSGYLARVQHADTPDHRAPVGTMLTICLGIVMVIITAVVLWDAIFNPRSRISANTVSLLTAVLGGGIGSAAAYLGLPQIVERVPGAPVTRYVEVDPEADPGPDPDPPPPAPDPPAES